MIITINDRDILNHAGEISHEMAKQLAENEYDKFHGKRLLSAKNELSDFDKAMDQIDTSNKKLIKPPITRKPRKKDKVNKR